MSIFHIEMERLVIDDLTNRWWMTAGTTRLKNTEPSTSPDSALSIPTGMSYANSCADGRNSIQRIGPAPEDLTFKLVYKFLFIHHWAIKSSISIQIKSPSNNSLHFHVHWTFKSDANLNNSLVQNCHFQFQFQKFIQRLTNWNGKGSGSADVRHGDALVGHPEPDVA